MERVARIVGRVKIGTPMPSDEETRAAKREFGEELLALAAAYRHELVPTAITVYWNVLKQIPVEIRRLGLELHVRRSKFFPTIDEAINACADVVEARRKIITAEIEAVREACELRQQGACNGEWRDTHQGVVRCLCHTQGLVELGKADAPIQRPALPPSEVVS